MIQPPAFTRSFSRQSGLNLWIYHSVVVYEVYHRSDGRPSQFENHSVSRLVWFSLMTLDTMRLGKITNTHLADMSGGEWLLWHFFDMWIRSPSLVVVTVVVWLFIGTLKRLLSGPPLCLRCLTKRRTYRPHCVFYRHVSRQSSEKWFKSFFPRENLRPFPSRWVFSLSSHRQSYIGLVLLIYWSKLSLYRLIINKTRCVKLLGGPNTCL